MATAYGSYDTSAGYEAYRAVLDYSTSQTNTQVTISTTGKVQSGYGHDSMENFALSLTIGDSTESKTSSAYLDTGATVTFGSKTRTYTRGHSAQTIAVKAYAKNDGTYTGWTGSSTASATVSVPARPSYTVAYNANGGTGAPSNQTKWYDEALTLSATRPTRANAAAAAYVVTFDANGGSSTGATGNQISASRTTSYTFSKWNTKSDGSGTNYNPSGSYTGNAALTLYAIWTSSTTTSQITLPTPIRSGYTFNGWYSGSTRVGGAGSRWTPTGTLTLKASWTQNTWTVAYAANGGSSTPSSQTKYAGTALTLAAAISRSNATTTYTVTYNYNGSGASSTTASATKTTTYAFASWKATDGTTYAAKGSYTKDAATTMTAQWTSSSSTTSVTLPTPTRTGYSFAGWYTAATNGSKVGNGGASYTPTASVTLYAHWTINSYTVRYDANGGTGAPASQTKVYGTTLTLSSTRPTRAGYRFLGWSPNAQGTGSTRYGYLSSNTSTTYTGFSYTANQGATLYAVWIAAQVTALTAYRSDSSGNRSSQGTYGHISGSWKGMGTIAGTVSVSATANGSSLTISSTGGSKAAGSDLTGTSTATWGTVALDSSRNIVMTCTLSVTFGGTAYTASAQRVAVVPKAFALFSALAGGTGLAIGTIATMESKLEVAIDSIFRKGLRMWSSNINRDGTAPSSNTWSDSEISFYDTDGERVGYVNTEQLTDGRIGVFISGESENTSGTDVYNSLGLLVARDGTRTVSVSDASAWRNGINAMGCANASTQNARLTSLSAASQHWAVRANVVNDTNTTYYSHDTGIGMANSGVFGYDFTGQSTIWTAYTTQNKPTASDVGALATTGGTLTGAVTDTGGNFIRKSDADLNGSSAPSSTIWGGGFYVSDTDGTSFSFHDGYYDTSRVAGARLVARNVKSDNSTVDNAITVKVARDGTRSYAVSDAAAFRSAISAQAAGSYQAAGNYVTYGADGMSGAFGNPGGTTQIFSIYATCKNSSNTTYSDKRVGLFVYNDQLALYNSTDSKWVRIWPGAISLYDNTTGTNGTVTLSQSVVNFQWLEVWVVTNNKEVPQCVTIPVRGANTTSDVYHVEASANTTMIIRKVRYTISGTSMTPKFGNYMQDSANTWSRGTDGTNYIYVTRVLGFNYH